jgi:hypothetical protein
LAYKGWIDVKWIAMENGARSILANVTTQAIHTLNDTASEGCLGKKEKMD